MSLSLPKSDVLHTEFDGRWLTLTMHDPKTRNALTDDMATALTETLDAVAENRSVRGITLQGSDGVFCSGGDLKGMARHISSADRDAIIALSKRGGDLFAKLNSQPQFVLVLIDGPAMAGGLGLACCADMIGMTATARFALTEAKLGIPPAQIAPYVVSRIGVAAARRLVLTVQQLNSEDAIGIGLGDHVAPDTEALDNWSENIKSSVLQAAPGALAISKQIILQAGYASPDTLAGHAADAFTDCLLSEEGMEGIASFVGKRKPSWAEDV